MSNALTKIDTNLEVQICAMLARNDTHQAIKDGLEAQGIEIALSTISKIKARNSEAISFMKNQIVQAETSLATKLVHKSRQILDKRLEQGLTDEEELNKLARQYREGEIDLATYRIKAAGRLKLSVAELTSLSKEMFNQSQVEQGKPTAITDNPTAAKQHLAALLAAINSGNTKDAVGLLFADVKP